MIKGADERADTIKTAGAGVGVGATTTDVNALTAPTSATSATVDGAVAALLRGVLLDGRGEPTRTLEVSGAPGVGKTEFALRVVLQGIKRYGADSAVMTVSNRKTADRFADRAVRAIGASSQARPVTTLSAVAFRVISAVRARVGEPLPRLLNGAEQDTMLRRVMAVHVRHAAAGDDCPTCRLLREYFAQDHWVTLLTDDDGTGTGIGTGTGTSAGVDAAEAAKRAAHQPRTSGVATSETLFLRGINDAFIVQLRDMLSRMNELGVSCAREQDILDELTGDDAYTARLRIQWRLAFALRAEAERISAEEYPGEFRLDAARLLVEGTDAVADATDAELPRFIVVDDVQDLTLAGLAFLEQLVGRGAALVAVGNPEESVQSFRGSYPEYLFERMTDAPFHAAVRSMTVPGEGDASQHGKTAGRVNADATTLGEAAHDKTAAPMNVGEATASAKILGEAVLEGNAPAETAPEENASAASGLRRGQAPNYRALVASRVSLSIRTVRPDDTPLPQRPGKLPWYDAALPIVALSDSALPDDAPSDARTFPNDGSVGHGLYRSANEELDDVVWAVKTAHLSERRSWNDLAILAHDNATVRAFGERLREDGVPVRYSSVTRPLKDEPFVRGLFSLIELAQLRNRGMANVNNEKLASLSSFVRLRVSALMDSPLVTVGAHGAGEPARLSVVEAAMRSLASLVSVIDGVGDGRERGWHADDVDHANYGEYADYAGHGHDGNHSDHVDRVDRAKYVDDANDANDVDDAGRVDQAERAGSGQSEAPGESVESDGSAATAGSANPSESSESFGSSEPSDGGDLRAVMEAWKGWRDAHMTSAMDSTVNQTDDGPTMVVDDTLVACDAEHVDPQHLNPQHLDQAGLNAQGLDAQRLDPQGGATRTFASANGSTGNTHGGPAFGIDALYLLLACDGYAGVDAAGICSSITTVTGNSLHARAFEQLWRMVDAVARGLATLRRPETQYALSLAWQACNVADRWQRTALDNTADGRAANDRLDAAMRLFEYAQGSGAGRDIDGFLDQVRSMRIEADSLAKVAPIDDAVTLTTPAGADGDHWPLVWIVGMQQGVWPNLAERNTMFGGEDLARIMLADNAQAHRDRGPEPNIVEDATSPDRLRDDAFASVLASEQRSFLVALTRASERLSVSAVSSDDMTPSDFLYGYLPEYFDRDLDAAGTPVYTEAGGDTRSGGMDADPRGLAALARARIMRHCSDVVDAFGAADVVGVANTVNASGVDEPTDVADSADATAAAAVDDAARALAVLAEQGVSSADPSNWAYLHNAENAENAQNAENNGITRNTENVENIQDAEDAEDAENAQNTGNAEDAEDADGPAIAAVHDSPASSSGPMVSLSPSAVDGLWGCPVCWLLENQFAGPGTGSVAQSFGTLIHLIAQLASAEGLDRPEHTAGTPVDERIAAVTARMMELYRQQRTVADDDLEAQERYDAMDKDKKAQATLEHIARYFVTSSDSGYLKGNEQHFEVGRLEAAECEVPFEAVFDMADMLGAYNAIPSIHAIDVDELLAIMGALVGGWPEGMRADLRVRLTGRIDRMEHRRLADGTPSLRLIDYKTGHKPGSGRFVNDLQLVCYQMGLAFGGDDESSEVAQSELFYVADNAAPAESHAPESLYQPTLFVSGHINDSVFIRRSGYKTPDRLLDVPELDAQAPEGVTPQAWREFLGLRSTQAVWAMTMIARVWYTAAARRSEVLIAHPTSEHAAHCRLCAVCPACAGRSDTIFDIREV